MTRVPDSLESIEASLRAGVTRASSSARRQALACAEQAATWGGEGEAGTVLPRARPRADPDDTAARRARPRSRPPPTRASPRTCATSTRPPPIRAIRSAASGTRCSPATSTASSSTSTRRTRGAGKSCTASRTRCARSPSASCRAHSIEEVIEHLDADDTRAIEGVDEFRRWNQDLIDQTISDLNGTHFDIARAAAAVRGDDRAARWRGGDVLHGPDRGLLPARSHVVPDDGPDPLPALEGGQHLLPRGGSRPSPAGRAGGLHGREAVALPAPVRVRLRPRRGLGAVRGTADGRARLPRGSRVRDGHARGAGDARGARHRRHRHAPRAADHRRRSRTRARRGRRSSRCRSSSSAAASPRCSCAARSTATSAGRARRSATRSASGCGSRRAPTRSSARAPTFDLKEFHTYALDLGSMGLGPLRDELARF